jgi:hypothetical protein
MVRRALRFMSANGITLPARGRFVLATRDAEHGITGVEIFRGRTMLGRRGIVQGRIGFTY